jgi:hypothetical protein
MNETKPHPQPYRAPLRAGQRIGQQEDYPEHMRRKPSEPRMSSQPSTAPEATESEAQ